MTNPFAKPKQPAASPPPPPVPTVDAAAQREEATRKFGRRKGFKANLYGGASPGAAQPNVNTKTLLG